ncbi:MAG TPA: hypothetical protein VE397_17995 [Stellaceae bacterium]|jgi:hypothetical protein|nr:hypothetical protein [Stellaceae bacterium]
MPPSPPLALSPINLALLQQRQPAGPARPSDGDAPPPSGSATPPPAPAGSSRGRLLDILA